MTIRDLVRDYILADATVAGLVGDRLWPNQLPQKVTYPAGVITQVDVVRDNTLRAVASLADARIQVDWYVAPTVGGSRKIADDIGAATRRRLDGFAGTMTAGSDTLGVWIVFDGEVAVPSEDIAGGLERHTAEYKVQYQTAGGVY